MKIFSSWDQFIQVFGWDIGTATVDKSNHKLKYFIAYATQNDDWMFGLTKIFEEFLKIEADWGHDKFVKPDPETSFTGNGHVCQELLAWIQALDHAKN